MPAPVLTFHGAARSVTGSCLRIAADTAEILIDCGLFQGSKTEKELNYRPFPFAAEQIAAVVLTHAHIDHSGQLPRLVRAGFAGPIHATPASVDLAGVMLPDSAHIQAIEVEQLNRRRAFRGAADVTPIYDNEDVARTMALMRGHPYGRWFAVARGVRARFWNAGHMLGSASVELEIADSARDRPWRLLVSGDIGPAFKLLHPDPAAPSDLDALVCESTYGDEDREGADDAVRRDRLATEVRAARRPGGVLIIPSFAVERAQELIADLSHLMRSGALPRIPVYVDSPLARQASEVFARHAGSLEGGAELVAGLTGRHVRFTQTVEQSRALDRVREFHIVIAASGMCEAGRIRHRLKAWIWRDEATVLFVGYQAEGTLGRILLNGASSVRIQGETYAVRARLRQLDLYSGHADGPELAAWVRARQPIRGAVFLVHGEQAGLDGLAARIGDVAPAGRCLQPVLDQSFRLTETGAEALAPTQPPRLAPERVAAPDWHNEASELLLDLHAALDAAADERARAVILRRLRRALAGDTDSRAAAPRPRRGRGG